MWFRAEFSLCSRFPGYPRRLGRHSRAVLCLPCFGRFRCWLGFGILYVASWTMEISAERNLCFRERLSQ